MGKNIATAKKPSIEEIAISYQGTFPELKDYTVVLSPIEYPSLWNNKFHKTPVVIAQVMTLGNGTPILQKFTPVGVNQLQGSNGHMRHAGDALNTPWFYMLTQRGAYMDSPK